jgi:hypothetical protein
VRVVSFLVVALALFVGGAGALLPQLLRHRTVEPELFHGTTSVVAVSLHGAAPREVRRLQGQWEFPVLTRDGKAVLLEHPQVEGTTVWRVPLDGSPKTKVGWKRVFTAPAGWRPQKLPPRIERLLARRRLAEPSSTRDGRVVYAVRLNDAVSIPK